MTSARMNPRSMSECTFPAAPLAVVPRRIAQARHSSLPVVKNTMVSRPRNAVSRTDTLASRVIPSSSMKIGRSSGSRSPTSASSLPRSATRASVLAPQAIHDLAGARFETLRTLAALAAAPPPGAGASGALEAVAEREEAAAERIRGRFRVDLSTNP